MIYYIGDTHFGHKNVIKYDKRPFANVEEMDTALISNWNRKVCEEDVVYILGDFCYKSGREPSYYLKQLKGHKHLIVGNHDKNLLKDNQAIEYLESVEDIAHIKDGNTDVVLCHYPMVEWEGCKWKRNPSTLIFSHIHNQTGDAYNTMIKIDNALNAGCMVNGYEPCTLRELQNNIKNWQCLGMKNSIACRNRGF